MSNEFCNPVRVCNKRALWNSECHTHIHHFPMRHAPQDKQRSDACGIQRSTNTAQYEFPPSYPHEFRCRSASSGVRCKIAFVSPVRRRCCVSDECSFRKVGCVFVACVRFANRNGKHIPRARFCSPGASTHICGRKDPRHENACRVFGVCV